MMRNTNIKPFDVIFGWLSLCAIIGIIGYTTGYYFGITASAGTEINLPALALAAIALALVVILIIIIRQVRNTRLLYKSSPENI